MNGPSGERSTEWTGGSLAELMSVLSAAALPARIRVFAPGASGAPAGEVHLLAGGISDAFAGERRGQEAVSTLQQVAAARFVIDTRLPDPETGSLAKPGPAEGNLAQRPLVEVMRYCEQYVLTCTLEVWRGEDQARISYRRGELVGTTVGGSDAPERLPEVMGWKEGFFEIDLPLPVTPPVPAPSRRNTGTGAVVGDSAAVRATPAEHPRRETDPFISLAAIKKSAPTRPAGAPLRPAGEGGPKLPRVPSLPGFKSRLTPAAGSRVVPSGSAPSPAASPLRGAALPSVPKAGTTPPVRVAPVVAQATPAAPAVRSPSTAGIPAKMGRLTPAHGSPATAPTPRVAAPAAPAAPASLPVERAPITARLPQGIVPSAPTPVAREARPAVASALAPVPWPAAKPAVAQYSAPQVRAQLGAEAPAGQGATRAHGEPCNRGATQPGGMDPRPDGHEIAGSCTQPPVQPAAAPAAEAAAKSAILPPSAAAPPPPSAPVAPPAVALAGPAEHKTPGPATPPPAQTAPVAASPPTEVVSPAQPAEAPAPPSSPEPSEIAPAAEPATSAPRRVSGDLKQPAPPPRLVGERPFGVELADDMQDPAAFVNTPVPQPQPPVVVASVAQTTPTPVSPTPERVEPPTVKLAPIAPDRREELAVDIEDSRLRPAQRRARRGLGDLPWAVHVLLGIALGAAVVVAYSVYYGLPLP